MSELYKEFTRFRKQVEDNWIVELIDDEGYEDEIERWLIKNGNEELFDELIKNTTNKYLTNRYTYIRNKWRKKNK